MLTPGIRGLTTGAYSERPPWPDPDSWSGSGPFGQNGLSHEGNLTIDLDIGQGMVFPVCRRRLDCPLSLRAGIHVRRRSCARGMRGPRRRVMSKFRGSRSSGASWRWRRPPARRTTARASRARSSTTSKGGTARRDGRRSSTRPRASKVDQGHRRRQGRYLFDFVEPGTYTVTAELDGFKKAEQKTIRVPQRGDVTVDLDAADRRPRRDGHGARPRPSQVQLNSSTLPDHAGAPAHRPGAAQRPQPVQPGHARPDD